MEMNDEQMERVLTPGTEEQTFLKLQGKCLHNGGWRHLGHGHNDDCYECILCKETKWW
jgi:hypothetical protein